MRSWITPFKAADKCVVATKKFEQQPHALGVYYIPKGSIVDQMSGVVQEAELEEADPVMISKSPHDHLSFRL